MKDKSFIIGDFDSQNYFELIEDITISPLTPKLNTVSLPERDGVLDFSSDNMWGRNVYEPRIITITGIVRWLNWNVENLYPDADKMVALSAVYNYAYKNSKGKLYLSTTPGVHWDATLEAIQNIETTGNTTFRVVIQYRCQPFSKDNAQEGIEMDFDAGSLTFNIPNIDWAPTNSFKIDIVAESGTEPYDINIINTTTKESLNLHYVSGREIKVDFENFTIDYEPHLYVNKVWDGDFFEIKPGDNIAIVTSNISEGHAVLRYTANYFYGKMSAYREV